MPAPSQLFRGGPTRHAMLNMGLVCPHTGPKRREITEASLTSLSACATTMPYSLLFPFSPSPLHSRVLGFLSHDGFIGGPLLKRFSLSSWSVQLGSLCCLAYQRRFVGHWAMDAEYKVISLPGSIKTANPPPTPAIIYHLHPWSGRKLLVSLTNVYWRHLISKG